MHYLSSISLALIVHVLLSIVVLMALACTATPSEPTPNIDATVDAQVRQKVASTVETQVKEKVALTVEAMSPTTSPQVSLPTSVPDDLIHVGETIEIKGRRMKETYGSSDSPPTLEIKYREWSEEFIAVAGPYKSDRKWYTFHARPGKKFVVLIFDVTNTSSRALVSPDITGLEILTEPYGNYFDGWLPIGGIHAKGHAASQSTPEEIEQFADWYEVIDQRQTVQMTAIFEISRDASPVQARVTSFGRPIGFD